MGKFTFKVLDIGLAVLIHPLPTLGWPVILASVSGYWAYLLDLPSVFIFQAAFWGWLLAFATVGILMLAVYAGRKASMYWQIKAIDALSELRNETVRRFWPVSKFSNLDDCRAQYSEFKAVVADHLEKSFSKSFANQYQTIGILNVPAPGTSFSMPASVPQHDHSHYIQLHFMVKRDLEWLDDHVKRFNDKYITRLA